MGKKKYFLKEVEYKGFAYRINNRIVRAHDSKGNQGAVFVPGYMIGKNIDFIIIPHKEELITTLVKKDGETKESNESTNQEA